MWAFSSLMGLPKLGFYPDFKKPFLRDGQVFGQKAIYSERDIFCTNSKIEKKGQICGLFGSHGPTLKSHFSERDNKLVHKFVPRPNIWPFGETLANSICGLFGSHGWICQLDFHPKLKSHFQRAAILINAHFFVHKNYLLIKGDQREAWGSFSARVRCNHLRMKAALKAVLLP
jgi:hypothetical protein